MDARLAIEAVETFEAVGILCFAEHTDEQLNSIIGQVYDNFSNAWGTRSATERKKVMKYAVKLFRERLTISGCMSVTWNRQTWLSAVRYCRPGRKVPGSTVCRPQFTQVAEITDSRPR